MCFQAKNALELSEVYTLRAKLHRQLYQHRIANVAESMITDIFLAADAAFRLRGPDGHPLKLSEAAHSPAAFSRLTDSILDAIDLSMSDGLEQAHELLERLKRRDFYCQVGKEISLATLPRCVRCGNETRIEAKHCSECGTSTATRKWVPDKSGFAIAPTEAITEASAAAEILKRCEPPSVRDEIIAANALLVKIVKISHGKSMPRDDPHLGFRWAVYDPLAHIGFYNPKDVDEHGHMCERIFCIHKERLPGDVLPSAYVTLTLFCYLRSAGPCRPDEPELTWSHSITKAIQSFRDETKLVDQEGTSNCPTPSHGQHTHERSVGNTPRASALSLSAARGRGAALDDRSRPPTGERPSQRAHSQRIGSNSQTFRSQSLEGIREESQQSSGSSAPNQL